MLECEFIKGDVLASTPVAKPEVHAEREVALVNQLFQTIIVANDDNYALAA